MKENIKKWLKPILFTAGGALVGLAYYYFVGCSTGACPLTSNPFITMAYMGFIGWLLAGVFGKGGQRFMQYAITFLEEIITFISPCLLPMLPIYISYFAGGGQHTTKRLCWAHWDLLVDLP